MKFNKHENRDYYQLIIMYKYIWKEFKSEKFNFFYRIFDKINLNINITHLLYQ